MTPGPAQPNPSPEAKGANAVGTAVPNALQGAAAGVLNTAAQLGTALGVAGLLLIAEAGDDTAYAVAAVVTLAGAGAVATATRSAGPASRPART